MQSMENALKQIALALRLLTPPDNNSALLLMAAVFHEI